MQILSLKTYVYLSILRCFPTYFYTCMCVYTHMYVCVDRQIFSHTTTFLCPEMFRVLWGKKKQILPGTGSNLLFECCSVCTCRNNKHQWKTDAAGFPWMLLHHCVWREQPCTAITNSRGSIFTCEGTGSLLDNVRSKRCHCTCWHPGYGGEKQQSNPGSDWPPECATTRSPLYPIVETAFRHTESTILATYPVFQLTAVHVPHTLNNN